MKKLIKIFLGLCIAIALLLSLTLFILSLGPVQQTIAKHFANRAGMTLSIDGLRITAGGIVTQRGTLDLPDGTIIAWDALEVDAPLIPWIRSGHLSIRSGQLKNLDLRLSGTTRAEPADVSESPLHGLNEMLSQLPQWRWPEFLVVDQIRANGQVSLPDGALLEFDSKVDGGRPGSSLNAELDLRYMQDLSVIKLGIPIEVVIDHSRRFQSARFKARGELQTPFDNQVKAFSLDLEGDWTTPSVTGGISKINLSLRGSPNTSREELAVTFQGTWNTGKAEIDASLNLRWLDDAIYDWFGSGLPRGLPGEARIQVKANLRDEIFNAELQTSGILNDPATYHPELAHFPSLNINGNARLGGSFSQPILERFQIGFGEGEHAFFWGALQNPLPLGAIDAEDLFAESGINVGFSRFPAVLFQPWSGPVTIHSGELQGSGTLSREGTEWRVGISDPLILRRLTLDLDGGNLLQNANIRLNTDLTLTDETYLKAPLWEFSVTEEGREMLSWQGPWEFNFAPEQNQFSVKGDVRGIPSSWARLMPDEEASEWMGALDRVFLDFNISGNQTAKGWRFNEGSISIRENTGDTPINTTWNRIEISGEDSFQIGFLRLDAGFIPDNLRQMTLDKLGVGFSSLGWAGQLQFSGTEGLHLRTDRDQILVITDFKIEQEREILFEGLGVATEIQVNLMSSGQTKVKAENIRILQGRDRLMEGQIEADLIAQVGSLGLPFSGQLKVDLFADPHLLAGQPFFNPLRVAPGARMHLNMEFDATETLRTNGRLRAEGLSVPPSGQTMAIDVRFNGNQIDPTRIDASAPIEIIWQNRRSEWNINLQGTIDPDLGANNLVLQVRSSGADLNPLILLGEIWDDSSAVEQPGRTPGWVDSFPILIDIQTDRLFLDQIPYIRNLQARAQYGAGSISVDQLRATLLSGSLDLSGALVYEPNERLPYSISASLDGREISLAEFMMARNPRGTPPAEGVFNIEGSFAGRGLSREAAMDGMTGRLDATGANIRLRTLAGPLQAAGADLGAIGGQLLGRFLNRPGIGALSSIIPILSDLRFATMRMQIVRPEDQSMELRTLEMQGDELRIVGSGQIGSGPISQVAERPMILNLNLASKGILAQHLNALRIIHNEADEFGFFPWQRQINIRGTLTNPDTREIVRVLEQAALGALTSP